MLNKKVKAVAINNEDNTCKKIILDQGEIIRCRYVIASSIYFSQWAELHHKIARAFYITARSINFQEDYFFINDEYKNKQNAFLVVPQNTKILVTDDSSYEISSNVFITQLSERSSSCPQNYFIIYMRSQSLNLDAALKDLKMLENYYFCTSKNCSTQCYQKPHALYAARYIQNCYRTKSFSSEVLPKNCYVINNDPPEFDFEPIIKEAQRIFHQTCPDEEFLPTAPNPEDIIYDD